MKPKSELQFSAPTISAKAKKIISTFTKREKRTYDYLLRLLTEELEHYVNCEFEAQFDATMTATKREYTNAMKQSHKNIFRLLYIADCLDINFNVEWELRAITITPIN